MYQGDVIINKRINVNGTTIKAIKYGNLIPASASEATLQKGELYFATPFNNNKGEYYELQYFRDYNNENLSEPMFTITRKQLQELFLDNRIKPYGR